MAQDRHMRERHSYRGYDIRLYLTGAEIWRDGEQIGWGCNVKIAKFIIDGYFVAR